MKVGVASTGQSIDGEVCSRFGRCPYFLIVESDTLRYEAVTNPASALPGGAGPAAIQSLAQYGVRTVIAGEFGPKAQQALDLAGIRPVQAAGPIRDALANL